MIKRFLRDESGATVIEYGLIVALLSALAMAGMAYTGDSIANTFNTIGNTVDNSI